MITVKIGILPKSKKIILPKRLAKNKNSTYLHLAVIFVLFNVIYAP